MHKLDYEHRKPNRGVAVVARISATVTFLAAAMILWGSDAMGDDSMWQWTEGLAAPALMIWGFSVLCGLVGAVASAFALTAARGKVLPLVALMCNLVPLVAAGAAVLGWLH